MLSTAGSRYNGFVPLPVRAVAAGLVLAGLLHAGCKTETARRKEIKPDGSRKAAPEFTLKDVDGKSVNLSDYKGKVVLLNFWATWCGPCKIEIPWFIDFEQKYKDRGFAVLGVAMDDEGLEVVKPYLEKSKVNYRIVLGNDSVATMYGGIDSLPTTFVLDKDGKIASTHIGLVSKGDYENEIQQLLNNAQRSDAGRTAGAVERAAN
jgi:cytochrome c biogenesis protein CcmG/thiol:disulfide interchange protein DsbE